MGPGSYGKNVNDIMKTFDLKGKDGRKQAGAIYNKILSNDSLVLGAKSVVSVNIDYDGNQTDRAFIVRNNTDLATGGTELFRVNEDGNSIFAGDVSSSVASTYFLAKTIVLIICFFFLTSSHESSESTGQVRLIISSDSS